ncbi:hypothetical protein ACFWVC_00615 [Streptomyces sp. NPDC058691]|uniref:hypothetical protein n=1 Tax=Streptomyces sp. NPDC058691 TaxID=3346601 RepID=UPI00364AAE19
MNGTIPIVTTGDSENTYIHTAVFPVNYRQFYLLDGNPRGRTLPIPHAPGESHAGILRTVRGGAFLVTGLCLGVVDLTVSVHHHEPMALLDEYEDVVEVSLEVIAEPLRVDSWHSGKFIVLPPLPSGAGWYRLRYHARDMERAYDGYSEVPIDSFHLQIWAEPQYEPEVLKITSHIAKSWLSAQPYRPANQQES